MFEIPFTDIKKKEETKPLIMFINTVDSAQMKFKYMSRKNNFNLWSFQQECKL